MIKKPHQLLELIEREIKSADFSGSPQELYDPITYIMSLGGKRLRPLLVTLAHQLFSTDISEALKQAIAVEVFHNFTLMHDDIMDMAPMRRGKKTVHEKWNNNTAILSGDVMLVKAYELLMTDDPATSLEILKRFSKCASQVCEGQQLDMLFETKKRVKEAEYIEMIRLKTAILIGFSLELGGLIAGADQETCRKLMDFGVNIGIGFQLKDDLLDVYGDKAKFGKQVGGDILSNKKTFLLITALEMAKGKQKKTLEEWLSKESYEPKDKVAAVTKIYEDLGIRKITEDKMNCYFDKGFQALRKLKASLSAKAVLKHYTESLINRER